MRALNERSARKKTSTCAVGALLRTRSKIGGAARADFGSHYWVGLQAPHEKIGSHTSSYRFVKSNATKCKNPRGITAASYSQAVDRRKHQLGRLPSPSAGTSIRTTARVLNNKTRGFNVLYLTAMICEETQPTYKAPVNENRATPATVKVIPVTLVMTH